jgi:DNA mismatch repair protein MSH2
LIVSGICEAACVACQDPVLTYTNCATGRFQLELYNPQNLMRLDRAAQSALHVFPARSGARSNTSIYGLLNHCRTAMGKRLLRSWLKQPLTDVAAIQQRHRVVQSFVDDVELR